MFKKFFSSQFFVLLIIVLLAAALRFVGINWDQNQHLHPDERFVVMTTSGISLPQNVQEYFDVSNSKFSPYNVGYNGYVYGTVPLFLVKIVCEFLEKDVYGNIHLVGRVMSGLVDLGTLLLVFSITKKLKNSKVALLAALLYAVNVSTIQQSHFYTVDNYLIFFCVLTFRLLQEYLEWSTELGYLWPILAGISYGLAVGSKLSALFFMLVIGLLFVYKLILLSKKRKFISAVMIVVMQGILMMTVAYLVYRVTNPYFFSDANIFNIEINPLLKPALEFNTSASRAEFFYPPSWQWVGKPWWFVFKNYYLWVINLGITSMLLAVIMILFSKAKSQIKLKRFSKQFVLSSIILVWILFLSIYISSTFVKTIRYMSPLTPFVAILAAGYYEFFSKRREIKNILLSIPIVMAILWGIAFVQIYQKDTTRIAATKWIYANIDGSQKIGIEHWDDPIPLNLPESTLQANGLASVYYGNSGVELTVFDPDDDTKIDRLYSQISQVDFIVLSSGRASDTVGKLPDQFPYMHKYYQLLETGDLGFQRVAEFSSYPELAGIKINDTSAEETFWVYDHPRVRIYKKIQLINQQSFRNFLQK